MSGNILNDRIKNDNLRGKLEVASTQDKIKETCIQWFIHFLRKAHRCNCQEK